MTGKSDPYKFEYKGIRLDPYRIEVVCGPWHPAQAHAIKKLMRAGHGAKSLAQDIDEAIASLFRWKNMMQEDIGQEDYSVRPKVIDKSNLPTILEEYTRQAQEQMLGEVPKVLCKCGQLYDVTFKNCPSCAYVNLQY